MQKGQSGEALVIDSEASCFYHPAKKAAVICDSCGRFLCSLCDLDLEGRHLCAPCLQNAQTKGTIQELESKRTLYDGIALGICLFGLVVFYVGFITAPAALYLAIRHRNAPTSLVRPRSWRTSLAIVISSLQILGFLALLLYLLLR
jgi:hypothetical protein